MPNALWPHELQHTTLASLSFTISWSLFRFMSISQWCHPTISSSVAPFSSCPQSFPVSGSFPMSRLFTSGGQSIGASNSASVLLVNIQGWFPLGLTGLISLLSKGLSRYGPLSFQVLLYPLPGIVKAVFLSWDICPFIMKQEEGGKAQLLKAWHSHRTWK